MEKKSFLEEFPGVLGEYENLIKRTEENKCSRKNREHLAAFMNPLPQ